jgi:Zn-dependent peptidase ImmA (M78 family)/DNA-binding XRE family transcriptional regulator
MIVLARESRGMVQKELAVAADISQSNLSKIESGILEATDSNIQRLSIATGYPVEFFYQTDLVYGYGSSCIYHRKRQSLLVGEYRRLLAKVNLYRIQIGNLLRGIEMNATLRFERLDISEFGAPEHVARLTRGMWGVPPGPVADLTALIESAGGIVVRCDFETAKLDAFSQWSPGMPPLFFVNSAIPADRTRYTLAHEVGHVLMHHIPTLNLEREADEFAAEFLMPRKEVHPFLRPMSLERLAELKKYWKVSMASLARRARDLERITDSQYKRLVTQMSRLGFKTREPIMLPDETPSSLSRIVNVHLKEHGYSTSQLSERIRLNESEFIQNFLPIEDRPRFRVI